jgi:hypothetical protein
MGKPLQGISLIGIACIKMYQDAIYLLAFIYMGYEYVYKRR